jgi:hypothetical protein
MDTVMVRHERSGAVDDKLNVPLEDAELLAEVELTTNLIIAASESEAALSQDQVDQLLGLEGTGDKPIPAQQRRPD